MSEHSAAPWRDEGVDGFGDHTIARKGNLAIAAVVSNLRSADEVAANARLIAAAPELLALARKVKELHELTREWANGGGDPEEPLPSWQRRRELEGQIREEAVRLVERVDSSNGSFARVESSSHD